MKPFCCSRLSSANLCSIRFIRRGKSQNGPPVNSANSWAHLDTATRDFSLSPPAERGERVGERGIDGFQTWAAVAFRQGGLLSPTLSSKGGEGGPVVGWWQCQDALRTYSATQ